MTQDKALTILKTGKNVFLTGEPGSGKTHTINLFTSWLKSEGIPYAVTASTGIAATHINGMTIHSWSGLGIKQSVTAPQIAAIISKPYIYNKIENTQVLIIDEISMLEAGTLDDINRIIKSVYASLPGATVKPFGGMQIVFVGDFFQLPPVSRIGNARFAFESDAWKEAAPAVCYLHEQHRQEDKRFLEILTAIRQKEIKPDHIAELKAKRKKADVISAKLFTHNTDVDEINNKELAKLFTDRHIFRMRDRGIPFLVETLKKHCLSPETLELKVGAVVMFTKNNFEEDYVNGTLGIIKDFTDSGKPVVKLKDGREIIPDVAEWAIEENGYEKAAIMQLPLRLAWAITVHKSQGMSLDSAEIDLSKAFEYGQGYVAISRVRSLAGLHLSGLNDQALMMHPKVVAEDNIFREQSDLNENNY